MASIAAACRLSARAASQQLRNHGARRAFHAGQASLAAQNFNMPALSPTMTEGNIATWKVKEGDSFSAGDVLLEIETDKAQMDVEAQDDGIVAKIIQGDGSKAVQVGTRIAVTAEPGDDISSLEIPAEDNPAPKKADAAKEESSKEPSKKEPSPPSKEERHSAPAPTEPSSGVSKKSGGKGQKQTYPLYPSVQHLLRENGLPKEEADKIPATGPSGRLLKGDVLAYLGKVEDSYNAEQSKRIGKLAHLDLSNIKLAAPKATPAPEKAAAKEETPAVEKQNTALALPISLKAVEECQKRLQAALGVFIPVSTLIARASELANEDLPVQNTAHPSADELFDAVLGLPKKKYARGRFTPEMKTGYSAPALSTRTPKSKTPDILDHLFGKKPVSRPAKASLPRAANAGEPVHFLSIKVPDGEGKRALVFLNRVKTLLEEEPGRLIV